MWVPLYSGFYIFVFLVTFEIDANPMRIVFFFLLTVRVGWAGKETHLNSVRSTLSFPLYFAWTAHIPDIVKVICVMSSLYVCHLCETVTNFCSRILCNIHRSFKSWDTVRSDIWKIKKLNYHVLYFFCYLLFRPTLWSVKVKFSSQVPSRLNY